MTQTQTQTPNQDSNQKFFELELFTWGRCRFAEAEILYPQRLDLKALTRKAGKHVIELDFATIEYENRDSNRNIHRTVKILAKSDIIVRYRGARSCNASRDFDIIYLITPTHVKELERKSEVVKREDNDFIVTEEVECVEYNSQKIIVSRTELSKTKKNVKLIVKKENNTIFVNGDTYYVKDKLKALGMKWNPDLKAWFSNNANIVDELKKIAEVVIEQ